MANGKTLHSNSFSALLEILDPQRFCRGVPVSAKHRDEVIVRRIKEDVRELVGGFPKHNVVQISIDGLPASAPELELSRLLDEYRRLRESRLKDQSKRQQAPYCVPTRASLMTGRYADKAGVHNLATAHRRRFG